MQRVNTKKAQTGIPREKFAPVIKMILPMLKFPSGHWLLQLGEAKWEAPSPTRPSMDMLWHSAIFLLYYFSCISKRSSTEQELSWVTTTWERPLQGPWQKVHHQGKETSDGGESLGHAHPPHSASGGVGSFPKRLKSSRAPHWFVKYQ